MERPTRESMEIFCFFLGIFYSDTWHHGILILLLALFFITPRVIILLFFILGLSIGWIHHFLTLPKGMPDTAVIPRAMLQGTITSIPIQNSNKTQFIFSINMLDNKPAQGLILLNWYNNPPVLYAGQQGSLLAKIKKPRNFRNPGSFDYVNALKTRHIYWTGYVITKNNTLSNSIHTPWSWLSLREQLYNRIMQRAPDTRTAGIIAALTLNLTSGISQNDWDLFRRTGTTHLFGISGEHIALIAGLCTLIIRWVWTRSVRCCLWIPAIRVASFGGLIGAFLYAFLAGFAPPVQRALIGNFFYTIYCSGKRRFTPWQIWRYAFFGVLCLEPHAIFMQGFYFSFVAVACLFLTQQRWHLKRFKKAAASQLSCLMGLMPLTLYWFSYGSINGFFANFFAIPLVGLFIVPLSLITLFASSYDWSWILIKPLSWLIALLFKGLSFAEYLDFLNINWYMDSLILSLGLMGALLIWVLLPIKPFVYLAGLWLIIPLFPLHKNIAIGEAQIQVLDVGQGLAVAIRTQNHNLLYDTGDQFFNGNDLGSMVILPYYQALGIKTIDTIVISHPDKDHRGGLRSVESGISVNELLVNDTRYYNHGKNCHDYPSWEWDGIYFRFFPIHHTFLDKNNNSCILHVSNSHGSILFTGDIEHSGEEYLIKKYGNTLHSDVMISPHHASNTSSTYRFLLEIAPRYAIASLGFDNRFHFPHDAVLRRMDSLGISFIRTDTCGMVTVRLPAAGSIEKPVCYNF